MLRRGFDSWWCHWNFSFTKAFRSKYGPGVDAASNRNEYQEYLLREQRRPPLRADNLVTFMPDFLGILVASVSASPKGLYRPVMGCLYLRYVQYLYIIPL